MVFRWILAILIIAHSLIHILGGFSELKIAQFNNLSGRTLFPVAGFARKILGAAWLVAMILLLMSAGELLFSGPGFLPLALAGTALSQMLIIVWWPDAKWGTVANVLIIIGLLLYK